MSLLNFQLDFCDKKINSYIGICVPFFNIKGNTFRADQNKQPNFVKKVGNLRHFYCGKKEWCLAALFLCLKSQNLHSKIGPSRNVCVIFICIRGRP